ncbi:TlpA family protein disulfide reductase [Hymenobacter siberiensis]|uniref:TlpA family protein disulfide reductase n=1 Tax=Hymenobacter siberiensis TaxID=2848396 RepID=UPI001C1E2C94|nr:TlpA disulfide reductase family protein [Hymenobacter siberiensis]
MKHLLLAAALLLAGLVPGCSPAERPLPPGALAAQVEALTKDFDTWWRNTYAYVLLARDYQPRDVDGRPVPKPDFLRQLATGRVLALRTGTARGEPVYQLCAYPGSPDPAIRSTSKQLAEEALRNDAREGQALPAFAWRDLNGGAYIPTSTRGKILVLKCWYTNCVACVDEMPATNALVERYRQRPDVLFVSLAKNEAQQPRPFLKGHPVACTTPQKLDSLAGFVK